MDYDAQYQDDTTIQYLILVKPSDLRYKNSEESGSAFPRVRNKVTSNDNKICVFEESYMDTVCVV